jgi:hypothetical protein
MSSAFDSAGHANFLAASTPLGKLKDTMATLSVAAIFLAMIGGDVPCKPAAKTVQFARSRRRTEQIDRYHH